MPNCYHNKRNYRRIVDKKKLNKKLDLIEATGYYGTVFWAYGYPGKNNHDRDNYYEREDACYIRPSSNSRIQKYYKRIARRKLRRSTNIYCGKGNSYRRNFDYKNAVY